ncbi:metal-dependent transcriptional regulator [Actinomyces sp. zg-332]|uniref:metal-dependent transcriptional regulator n=1 Tax=Actinomyces sp. zg-332 TaxID=2708340 RepID=UPI0014239675|nr:metal-dependent transcriptional regulator [Actinomyces sp. zg-332]QPK93828.1 metal-dependent transcriptional regulator [Actinomyces sp. zg-332]
MISSVSQQHLKVIYSLSEWSNSPVSISVLASNLGVANSTVSESIKKLAERGLVNHEPYKGITLTDSGLQEALKAVRAHRLLETFLYKTLKYPVEEIHDETQALQLNVTDRFLDKIEEFLGFPEVDPHGDPIPNREGVVKEITGRLLSDLHPGDTGKIVRISDANSALLCYLEKLGVVIGTELEILERHDFAGITKVKVSEEVIDLASPSLNSILVQ